MSQRYTHGMDVARARALLADLEGTRGEIDAVLARSGSAVSTLLAHWGADNRRRVTVPWQLARADLESSRRALNALAQRLEAEIAEQESTSAAGDPSGARPTQPSTPGPVGPGGPGGGGTGGTTAGPPTGPAPEGSAGKGEGGFLPSWVPADGKAGWDYTGAAVAGVTGFALGVGPKGGYGVYGEGVVTEGTYSTTYSVKAGFDKVRDGEAYAAGRVADLEDFQGQFAKPTSVKTDVEATLLQAGDTYWDVAAGRFSGGDAQNGIDVALLSSEGTWDARATIGKDGVSATAAATAGVYLAQAKARFTQGPVSGQGTAFVGAEAKGSGTFTANKDGLSAKAGAEAFAGGKATGSVAADLGPVAVGVGGEISYGIGAHANIGVEANLNHVGVNVDIGATLGIGGGLKFSFDIDPNPFD